MITKAAFIGNFRLALRTVASGATTNTFEAAPCAIIHAFAHCGFCFAL